MNPYKDLQAALKQVSFQPGSPADVAFSWLFVSLLVLLLSCLTQATCSKNLSFQPWIPNAYATFCSMKKLMTNLSLFLLMVNLSSTAMKLLIAVFFLADYAKLLSTLMNPLK